MLPEGVPSGWTVACREPTSDAVLRTREALDFFLAHTPVANRIVHDLVAAHGGSISAEHGIGQQKKDELTRYKSAVELDLMRAIKAALDPAALLNPGKVL